MFDQQPLSSSSLTEGSPAQVTLFGEAPDTSIDAAVAQGEVVVGQCAEPLDSLREHELAAAGTEEVNDLEWKAGLKEDVEAIRAALHDLTSNTLKNRYMIGVRVLRVMNEARYGERGVEHLAEELGVAAKTLRTHGAVVEAWPDAAEFDIATGTPGKAKFLLTWSHMVELSRLDSVRREEMRQRCLADALSVGGLRSALGAGPVRPTHSSRSRRSTTSVLRGATSSLLALTSGPGSIPETVQFVAAIKKAWPRTSVEDLFDALTALEAQVSSAVATLRGELKRRAPAQLAARKSRDVGQIAQAELGPEGES